MIAAMIIVLAKMGRKIDLTTNQNKLVDFMNLNFVTLKLILVFTTTKQ